MIIKSMSRKSKSFAQLYDYLRRNKNNLSFTRNTYSDSRNKKKLIKEFLDNYEYIKNSRGSVSLYHEIISLEENNLSVEKQKEILIKLSNKYLELRANNHLAFWVIHEDKNNIHLHLMISSNELEWNKRIRISKKDFADIQNTLEQIKNEYKELSTSNFYRNKKDLSKSKQKEQEIKNRKVTPIKGKIKEDLYDTFKKATSKTYLENHLKYLGYEVYEKGKTVGVIYKNKKYRLKTLWLDRDYKLLLSNIEKIQKREQRWKRQKRNRKLQRLWR